MNQELKLKRKVYLAGPFFNDHQRDVISKLEDLLDNHLMVTEVFSPSRDGVKLVMGESTFEERKSVFLANCYNIDDASVVVAFTNNHDQGTYWEIGRALNLGIPVVQVVTDDADKLDNMAGYVHLDDDNSLEMIEMLVLRESTRSLPGLVVLPSSATSEEVESVEKELLDGLESKSGSGSVVLDVVTIDDFDKAMSKLSKNLSTPSVIALSIDDRDPKISQKLGELYASELKTRVITFSRQNYGVNLMLQHSIVSHSVDTETLLSEIVRLSNYDYVVDESHYKSTEEFE